MCLPMGSREGCLRYLPNKKGCAVCQKGYMYNHTNYECVACDPSCSKCENYTNYCLECAQNYYRTKDGTCQSINNFKHCKELFHDESATG